VASPRAWKTRFSWGESSSTMWLNIVESDANVNRLV